MNVLDFIYRNGIVLSLPLFLISALLLFLCVQNLIKLAERSRLYSLPLIEKQNVRFDDAGTVALSLEGPRLSRRFSELSFDLVSPNGKHIASSASWFRVRSSGVSTFRMELVSFPVPGPGQYVLHVLNLGAAREGDSAHRIVLSRSSLATMTGFILGAILSAGVLIASIVLYFLKVSPRVGEM